MPPGALSGAGHGCLVGAHRACCQVRHSGRSRQSSSPKSSRVTRLVGANPILSSTRSDSWSRAALSPTAAGARWPPPHRQQPARPRSRTPVRGSGGAARRPARVQRASRDPGSARSNPRTLHPAGSPASRFPWRPAQTAAGGWCPAAHRGPGGRRVPPRPTGRRGDGRAEVDAPIQPPPQRPTATARALPTQRTRCPAVSPRSRALIGPTAASSSPPLPAARPAR